MIGGRYDAVALQIRGHALGHGIHSRLDYCSSPLNGGEYLAHTVGQVSLLGGATLGDVAGDGSQIGGDVDDAADGRRLGGSL